MNAFFLLSTSCLDANAQWVWGGISGLGVSLMFYGSLGSPRFPNEALFVIMV
jgi:hypothetical protein